MTPLLLGLALGALAAWDLFGLVAAGQRRAAVVVGTFWAVAIGLALLWSGGFRMPSVARLFVQLAQPVSRWIP